MQKTARNLIALMIAIGVYGTFKVDLNNTIMNCDECKHYSWYYDKCTKWDCKVDSREVHSCNEPRETPIRNMMVGAKRKQSVSCERTASPPHQVVSSPIPHEKW
jgi:hypothetical protein